MDPIVVYPYFTFRDMTRKGLLIVKIFVSQSSVQFAVNKKAITITFSDTWNCSLKILLPVQVIEPESIVNVANYDEDAKCYIISLKRANHSLGRSFSKIPDLDVITKYLTWGDNNFQEEPDSMDPKDVSQIIHKIGKLTCEDKKLEREEPETDADEVDGEKYETSAEEVGTYGFARRYKNKLSSFEGNWRIAVDLPDPDTSNYLTRYVPRWENERQSFDLEHYLADYFLEPTGDDDDEESLPKLTSIIMNKLYWQNIKRADEHILEPNQMQLLAQLPYKTFNLTKSERVEVLHSLFDIILAYAFDYRINDGKHNSESAWNVNKLSATLSWFQVHKNAGEAVTSFFRRSLTFPLYRYWSLSLKVLDDAIRIFRLGRRQILNCLIRIYELFEEDDDRRILNELYISDYLIWIQQVHPQTIKNYVCLIESCKLIKKHDVFSMLPEIEQSAVDTLKSEDEDYYEEAKYRYNMWRKNLEELTTLLCKAADISDDSIETSLTSSYTSLSSSLDYSTTDSEEEDEIYYS